MIQLYLDRNCKIENWDKTFLNIAERMVKRSKDGHAYIINPIVGVSHFLH